MEPIPPMTPASTASTVAFLGVVVAVAVAFVHGMRVAGPRLGEDPAQTRRWWRAALVGTVAWLVITAAIPASGVLEAPGLPPRPMIFMAACNLLVLALALSRVGTRLVDGLPVAALIGFQAFRLPLELVLHRWYVEGVLPVQMTYVGRNLDILTGIGGLAIGLWLWRRGAAPTPRWAVWLFNLVGLGLLVNVAVIAILSSPVPFRTFMNEPAVLLVFHVPYAWILPMCVATALGGHVLVFRWLWRTRDGAAHAR